MASFDYQRMRMQGRVALDGAAYPPKKMILIHSGVTIGLSLVLSVLNYLLDMGIDQTSGLSGIGTRAVLETIQSLLQIANSLLLPFWSIGYIRAVLNWTRREDATPWTLLSGFLHLRPVLRLMILQGAVMMLLGMVGIYAGTAVFLLTPGAQPLYALLEEAAQSGITDPYALLENEAYVAVSAKIVPYVAVCAGILIAPMAYRLRFAEYVLMDAPREGALRAMLKSWQMTRKNCWALLKLDLRFWWYHLAGLLILALSYGDTLLPMLGIELSMGADAAMFAFYIAALICELGLYVWQKNEVTCVYALAYDQLSQPQEEVPQPEPKRVPWSV